MMPDFISIHDNVLSPSQCKKFITYIDELETKGLLFHHNDQKHLVNQKGINLAYHYDLNCWSWVGENFLPVVEKYINNYIENYSILSESNLFAHSIKVKKILPGGGFHRWHYESSTTSTLSRCLVLQLYLNTIEEGGETEFLYLNKRVQSKSGRLMIFPSGFTHTHRGNPPINQTKYIVTTWLLFQEK